MSLCKGSQRPSGLQGQFRLIERAPGVPKSRPAHLQPQAQHPRSQLRMHFSRG